MLPESHFSKLAMVKPKQIRQKFFAKGQADRMLASDVHIDERRLVVFRNQPVTLKTKSLRIRF